jgi:hypothetical protein
MLQDEPYNASLLNLVKIIKLARSINPRIRVEVTAKLDTLRNGDISSSFSKHHLVIRNMRAIRSLWFLLHNMTIFFAYCVFLVPPAGVFLLIHCMVDQGAW